MRAIEKAINSRLPRVTLPDFDYQARAQAPPLDQRPPRPQGGHGRRSPQGARAGGGGGAHRAPHGAGSGAQQRRTWSGAPRRRP